MKKKKQNVTKKKTIKPALRGRLEREASRRPNVDLDANLHTTSPHLLHPQQQSPTSASGNKEKKGAVKIGEERKNMRIPASQLDWLLRKSKHNKIHLVQPSKTR